MTTFVGSHRILRTMRPSNTAAVLFFSTLAAMFVGRFLFEGVPYQISFSAMIGDTAGLIVVVLRAQEILKGPEDIKIPIWLQNNLVHTMILLVSFLLGVIVCTFMLKARQGQIMDIYHDVVIAPTFVYLGVTLLPVIYCNGTRRELFGIGSYTSLYLACGVVDWATGMIAQRPWLAEHLHWVWPVYWFTLAWSN